MTKKIFIRAAASALVWAIAPTPALGALVISEVMYDPAGTDAGREWVEVWNDGPSPFDLATVYLREGDVNHKIAAAGDESAVVPAGGRAVIADKPELFAADYPAAGAALDSAFSLANSGERIALVDADGDEHSFAEWGSGSGAADGRSWQRAGDAWIAAAATPGAENADREEAPAAGGASAAAGATAISAHSGTGGLTTVRREPALEVDAGRARVVPVGVELEIEPEVEGAARSSFSWSWGDGGSSRGRRGRHAYRFPGVYAVVLNARGAGGAVATSRTTVTAVEAKVAVAATPGGEGAVELSSQSAHELNLGGFAIQAGEEDFELPPDTILAPGGKVRVPNELSRLAFGSTSTVILRRPDGRAVKPL